MNRPDPAFGPGASPDAELFCDPSPEARRLLRAAPRVVHATGVQRLLVVPFCQLAFCNFDLQVFTFELLHTTRVANATHLVGITSAHLFGLALVGHLGRAAGVPGGELVAALLLAIWHGVVARTVGLWAWGAVMGLGMAALGAGALVLGGAVGPQVAALATLGSTFAMALSHLTEPTIPPRAADPMRWVSMRDHVLGTAAEPVTWGQTLRRVGQMAVNFPIGLINETVAFPRVYPYAVLLAMMRMGYAHELRAELQSRVDRARASGNPAVDYVGIGGGTTLSPRWGELDPG